MSLIIPITTTTPLCILQGANAIEAHLTGGIGLKPRCFGENTVIVRLSRLAQGKATIQNLSVIEVFGRLNSEPNKFGSSIIENASSLEVVAKSTKRGKAVLFNSSEIIAKGRINAPDSDEMILLIQVTDNYSPGFGKSYSARLKIDDVLVPIRDFSFDAGRDLIGMDLNVTLARNSDRNAFNSLSDFKFDFYDNGTWKTLFSSGTLKSNQFNISFQNGRASDVATLSTDAPVSEQLSRVPLNNETYFDSNRLTLNASEYSNLYDTDGNVYTHQLKPMPGMTFQSLCNKIFIDLCGFDAVKTTIKDFPIQRADFSFSETYFEGIGKYIGTYDPLAFVVDNVLWILDSSATFPPGFAIASPLTPAEYKSIDLNRGQSAIDGYILEYSEIGDEYDYFLFRTDDPEETENGENVFEPGYSLTTITTEWKDFYKNSNPALPVRSERYKRTTVTTGTFGDVIASEVETFEFDTLNRATKTTIISHKVIPALSDPFEFSLTKTSEKITTYEYKADLFDPKRTFCYLTTERESGLITIDENDLMLGKSVKQAFDSAYYGRNLREGQTTEFGAIKTIIKRITQKPNGQFSTVTRQIDHLIGENGRGHVTTSTASENAGDITINAQTSQTRQTIVLAKNAPRTNRKLIPLPGGEIPVKDLEELARRKLARIGKFSGNVTLKGVDLSARRGGIRELFDRNGASLGVFIIEGVTISGQNLGLDSQKTTQILQVQEI